MRNKRLWSLWDIRNRWLRALASWVFIGFLLAIYPLVWLVFILIVLAIGAIEFISTVREHVRSEIYILLPSRRGLRMVSHLLTAREKPRD